MHFIGAGKNLKGEKMKTIFVTMTMATTMAVASSAFASDMDAGLKAACMTDPENSAEECTCGVAYVKEHMDTKSYTLMHALATTEDGSEDRASKLAALGATPESMQSMGEKFQSLAGDLKAQCDVNVGSGDAG